MKVLVLVLFIVFTSSIPVVAALPNYANLFPKSVLAEDALRYSMRIFEMYQSIRPHLHAAERDILDQAVPRIRDPQADDYFLLFYADSLMREVFFPVLSMKMLEDISTAYAWLFFNGYSLDTIDIYLAMLRYKPETAFDEGRFPTPLEALGIPQDALSDERVDDLSLRLRNTALGFIFLHELGHVLHGHQGTTREQERQADLFALDVMERTKDIPMGAIIYFQAQAYSLRHRAHYASDSDWEAYMAMEARHLVTTERLQAIALYLDNRAQRETRPLEKEDLTSIAMRLMGIASIIEDQLLGRCIMAVAQNANTETLKPRQTVLTVSEVEKWCREEQ